MIKDLGLDNGASKVKFNPCEAKTLVNDKDGIPMSGKFRYSGIVGIMMYLDGNNQMDLAYAL